MLNYPMIKRVVEYCKGLERMTGKKFTFELITNGTLLTADVVDFLVENRFLLFISLDGWQEMHEYNRPALDREGSHEVIVRNAIHAREQYEKHKLPAIKIRANLTSRFHDTVRVARYFETLGFKLMGIGAIEPLPHGDPSPAALTEDQMDQLETEATAEILVSLEKIKQGGSLGIFESRRFNANRSPLSRVGVLGVTCGVCRNTTVVDNRGNMYPCHRYAEMNEYVIGHVSTGLNHDLVINYYRRINGHATSDCHDCWIRDYCGGGCAWLLSDKDGKIHHPTQRECSRRRLSMERRLWLRKVLRESMPKLFDNTEEASLSDWDWDDLQPVRGEVSHCKPARLDIARTGAHTPLPVLKISQGGCSTCSENSTGCGCQS